MAEGDAWLGKTLEGRFFVMRLLGRGGMGAVYEAEHLGLDRKVAIKVIDRTRLSASDLQRFRREAKHASKVVHPNVVQVFDFLTSPEGNDYLIMEYVAGRDLGEILASEAPLAQERAIAIARQMLRGLHAIHEQGIVHRDIKPSNVLIAKQGGEEVVKLADFGIARGIYDRSLTRTGQAVGTPQYMAPEQFRGGRIDHRADLYAVGVTLYEMLAGEPPFAGNTAELAGEHVFSAPRPLTGAKSIVDAVMRALEKSPHDRFADARAFADALDGKAAEPVEATLRDAPTAVERPSKQPRQASGRRSPFTPARAGIALAALVAVVAVVGLGFYLSRREPASAVSSSQRSAPADAAVERRDDALAIVDAAVVAAADPPIAKEPASVRRTPAAQPGAKRARCQCIPAEGPRTIGLCPRPGTPLCRCDGDGGRSLCPAPVVPCQKESIELPEFAKHGRRYSDICDIPSRYRCPDLTWDRFAKPATHGAPCTGYPTPGRLTPKFSREQVTGKWSCDLCPSADVLSFEGAPGAVCTGYHYQTGQRLDGTLRNCD